MKVKFIELFKLKYRKSEERNKRFYLLANWLDYSEKSFVIQQQVLNASHMMQILLNLGQ